MIEDENNFDVQSRQDVARLRALRDAATQRDLFGQIVESLPDGLVVVDHQGKIIFVNHQAELMFGYSRDELVGQNHEVLIPSPLRDDHTHHRMTYQLNPHTRPMGDRNLVLMGLSKYNGEFPVEIMLAPLVTIAGVYTAAVIRRPR